MYNWIIHIMDQFGYLGIVLLIAIENIFPPIPSEVILTFGGFMTTYTRLTIPGVILSATAGSLIGAMVLYGLGHRLSPQSLQKLLDSAWARTLRFQKNDVDKAVGWFERHGKTTVFVCRFIPVMRSLISIPAGISRMAMPQFLLLTTLGTILWNTLLVSLGAFAGDAWRNIADYMDLYSTAAVTVMSAAVLTAGILFYKKRKAAASKK
jgi:membrane protein DedA with SNARE-associated domain